MSPRRLRIVALLGVATIIVLTGLLWAIRRHYAEEGPFASHDWPQWRYDASRTGASPQQLPAELHRQWVLRLPPPSPAWRDPLNQDRMGYDICYEPVVAGSTMFIPDAGADKLLAVDTRTGQEKWRFYAAGPVRLPPAVCDGLVYFVSDDGYLYCVSSDDGQLRWKFRGGPGDLRVLGNERLISAWPARGGPVVADNVVYFAAGIWPFMGVFIHALDAQTGDVVWTQDGCSFEYVDQPHDSPAFAGPSPQGSLTIAGDRLLVPSGRGVPACLDRATGELLYYKPASSKLAGGSHVAAIEDWFLTARRTRSRAFGIADGVEYRLDLGCWPVLTDRALYFAEDTVQAKSTEALRKLRPTRRELANLWQSDVRGRSAMIKAGNRLYAADGGKITAIDLTDDGLAAGQPRTAATIDGTVGQMLAADGRLFVVCTDGAIYAFGALAGKHSAAAPEEEQDEPRPAPASLVRRVQRLIRDTRTSAGYCLVLGSIDTRLLDELLRQSQLHVVVIDADEDRVARLRRRMDDGGAYGRRVAVLAGDPLTFELPPYFASLVLVENPKLLADEERFAEVVARFYHWTRPYGGVIRMPLTAPQARTLDDIVWLSELPGAELDLSNGVGLLRRQGPLSGAGSWVGQYGNTANTVRSEDALVRAPLGLLWFDSANNADVLPRHANGPPPQVIGGRLFIQGTDSISARDVYTGRTLWTTPVPDLGTFGIYYDETHDPDPLVVGYNQVHRPGANARGTNFFATSDAIYVLTQRGCLKLDVATGHVLTRFELPASATQPDVPAEWGFLAVHGNHMIAGSEPMVLPQDIRENMDLGRRIDERMAINLSFDYSASRTIVVRDLRSGRILWSASARQGFMHNAIAVGDGKLFCIDMLPPLVVEALQRRGQFVEGRGQLLAFDLHTGQLLWQSATAFGSWLSFSAEHDVLIQAGRPSRNMLLGEVRDRIACHAAADGRVIWDRTYDNYAGPLILHGDTIISQGAAFELATGLPKMRTHPITGEQVKWRFVRNYGCGTAIGSPNLLMFRSAAAGFYDLTTDGGTGNLGGFRSGCTSNMIPADGILNAPDYTRTCTCAYQNQASLGLIHMPGLEVWTFSGLPKPTGRIQRVGLNFAAPGDRQADDGTLWLDVPSVGGPSPDVPVVFEPTDPRTFRRHSVNVRGGQGHPWVQASGLEGVRGLTVALYVDPPAATPWWQSDLRADESAPVEPAKHTVRLFFCEMSQAAGQRVFDVWLGDEKVLENFDPAAEAGGPRLGVVRQFGGVTVHRELSIRMAPSPAAPDCEPILNGVEIVIEDQAANQNAE